MQYLLMLQIKGFPGREWATVGELAERLQAKHHGVASLISRCETAALVRRNISRIDRRRVEVQLTKKATIACRKWPNCIVSSFCHCKVDFTYQI